MIKYLLMATLCASFVLKADYIEIERIENIRPHIVENTLCLFDIDDTLIDNPSDLGSIPWRAWAKPHLPKASFPLYDALSLYIARNQPYKLVEPTTAHFIAELQEQGLPILAFTSRGRSEWYTTYVEGVDIFTEDQLNGVGIDFKNTLIPEELKGINPNYFWNGMILTQHIKKGDFLNYMFTDLNYIPSFIVFVDDKLEHVLSVDAALKKIGIPYQVFWYRSSELARKNFNPQATNLQLEYLLLKDEFLSDEEAQKMAQEMDVDPKVYLKELFDRVDLDKIKPESYSR